MLHNVPRKLVATVAVLAALGGTAHAAAAPTVSTPKVYAAGQKTPVDVAGNDLRAGDTIRKGTKLLRWKVRLNGANNHVITLRAPRGYRHVGLAINDGRQIGFAVAKGSRYYESTIKVRVYAFSGADAATASGHMYALVKLASRLK